MSELNRLKVVDFTMGRSDSDELNTNLPFADNFEKTRTIQQANVVLGAYVNRNYKDMQNKADKDEIPTKLSELTNDVGYITEGDIPSKTSDLTNDGADGEHPFITKEVDNLTNYTDTETLNTDLGLINGDISDINTDIQNLQTAIDLQLPNRIGDIVVDSIRSKNLVNVPDQTVNAGRTLYCLDTRNITGNITLSCNYNNTSSITGIIILRETEDGANLQEGIITANTSSSLVMTFNVTNYNTIYILARGYSAGYNYTISNFQVETGSTKTPFKTYQNLNGLENYSTEEQLIGTFLNKPLYRKVFDIGSLPNNSTKTVATGLSNIIPRNLYGYGYNSTSKVMLALNSGNPVGLNFQIQAYYSDGNILIQTGSDRSSYSGYVTLEYTKTTD